MRLTSSNISFLLSRHGKEVTLISKSLGTYDPDSGGLSGTQSDNVYVLGHFSNYSLDDITGGQVILGDRKLLLSGTDIYGCSFEPDIGDEVKGEGDTVSIVSVQKIMSYTNTICYICQVRE